MPPRNHTTTGARDTHSEPGDSPDNASVTDNSSAATPAQAPIVPEPINLDLAARNTSTVSGTPGLGNGDEPRVDVETTGEFMLQDPYTGDVVAHEGKSNVRKTSFIDEKILAGQLKEV